MKLTTLFLLLGCLHLSARGVAQNISLSGKNMSLEEVLNSISKQSGYYFLYKYNEIQKAGRVNLQIRNVPLQRALEISFKGQPFSYRIENKTIVVTEVKPATDQKKSQTSVKGSVKDQSGQALPGATIRVKGSNQATVTDIDGNFNLRGLANDAVLLISFTGFVTAELPLNGRTTVQVVLKEDSQDLSEVVVVGYGTQKKINVTGSVAAVRAEDIQSRPVPSVNSALQGMMPGVTIVNSNGRPGSNNASIRIRGVGTLNNASPLIVIDGVPGGDMSILNPEDIESVSVLKDAASAAIYGVRGANGVILVTTKKGKSGADGKSSIAYNGYFGLQTPTALPEMASSAEYMELMNEALVNARSNPSWSAEQIQIAREGSDPDYFANTRWIEEIYKSSAPQQNHNVSLNGGMGEKSTYYLSYGYLNQGGLITGDNFNSNRHNVRLRLNTTLFDRLTLDGNVGYIDRNYTSSSDGTATSSGPLNSAMAISPLVPVRFSTGGWGYHGGQRNPIAMTTDGGTDAFDSQEFTGNIQANLKLMDGLNLRGQYAQVRYHTRRNVYARTVDYIDPFDVLVYQSNVPNKMDARSFTRNYNSLLGMLEYEKTFGSHYVKALAAASQEEDINNDINASRTNFPVDGVPSLNLGTENQLNSNPATQWALQSFFGRLNYSFGNRYLLEGNFRRDGSSRFASSLRWDWFSSLSAGWIFTEEPFFPKSWKKVLDVGKVRLSYGNQGNDQVGGNFDYMGIYASRETMPIGNELTLGYWQPDIANRLLTWESVTKKDIGIDLAMFNNRLNITADYYINETKDILLAVPLPDVLGANYPVQNAGSVENKGWEFQIGWRSRVNNLSYGFMANLSDVRNKVTGYGGAPPVIGNQIRRVGDPIDAFYGLVADRIAQEADFDYNPATGAYIPRFPHIAGDPVSPGDIIYKVLTPTADPAKAYEITDPQREYISLDKDRQVIGSAIPRYTYGFRGELGWKGIDFSFFLQGVGQIDGLLQGQARHAFIDQGTMPQKLHLDRWTPQNPEGSYPRLVYNQSYNARLSTFWLQDASYLRLKNIQLGYTLPKSITRLPAIGAVRVYASAENLFTSTDFFYGFDPEIPVSSGGIYPQVKTFVFGLSVNLK